MLHYGKRYAVMDRFGFCCALYRVAWPYGGCWFAATAIEAVHGFSLQLWQGIGFAAIHAVRWP